MDGDLVGDAAAGALGGIGADVAKTLFTSVARPWLKRYFERFRPAAQVKAYANAEDFLVGLVRRVEILEASTANVLETALEDPDVAAVLQSALLGAARTSSHQRHEILARAVAERLTADGGSVRAVASSLAVETVHKLATPHLDVLGLLAVIYTIRPNPSMTAGEFSAEGAARYADWFHTQFAHYTTVSELSTDTLAHLAASSCIILGRRVRRDLVKALLPNEPGRDKRAFAWNSDAVRLPLVRVVGHGSPVKALWDAGLQTALPTPAGQLIGCAVHDAKAGTENAVNWEWAVGRPIAADLVDQDVWDGRAIDRHFVQRLVHELQLHGIEPWTGLNRNPRGGP
jgi:hypothetical protein